MKKLAILVLVASFVALLYGCGSHSGGNSGININSQGDIVSSQRTVVIDDLGRLPTLAFSSGTSISGAEENTLRPGIKVIITEQGVNPKDFSYFNNGVNSQIYVYRITAFQESSTSAGSKTYVTTIEKPFTVTIPTNSETGICYLGIRENDSDPWRFMRVGAENEILANNVLLRASSNIAPKECTFKLYRLGISFCLVVYKGSSFPEIVVDSITASATASIPVEDGKYQKDLLIQGEVKGQNIGNIKPGDIRTRITYRSNVLEEAPIKVNGTSVKQTNIEDKTVPGYTYNHSFLVDNLISSSIGANGDFNFTLNLNGIETKSFPTGFFFFFFNKANSTNVLPFNYSYFCMFNKPGSENEEEDGKAGSLYNIVYDLAGGRFVLDNPTIYGVASDSIVLNAPIKDGCTFIGWTGSNGDTPQINVFIPKGSKGLKTFTANWEVGTYKVILSKGAGIDELIGAGTYEAGVKVTASCTMLPGYEFDFWTGNNTESTFTMPANDIVMQANAKIINYSIICNLKGGNITVTNPTSYNVDSDKITLNKPTRPGYVFTGWSGTDLTGTNNLEVSIPHGSTGNREYTANWKLDTYTITYDIGEGNLASQNPTTYDVASADITLSNPVPTKDYYVFKGWSGTDLEGSENLTVTIPQGSDGNRTYTANYAPQSFPITYDLKGETADNPDYYDVTTISFLLNNPTKEGYEFVGWEGTGIPEGTASKTVVIQKGSTGARNYVASYSILYKITYNLDGGTADNPTVYSELSDTFTLARPTKEGDYEFAGWTGTGLDAASLTLTIPKGSTGDREYTANWSQLKSFDLPGGIKISFAKCPAGSFLMGSPDGELGQDINETPHEVTISKDYWLGIYEVTQAQFRAVMGDDYSFHHSDDGSKPSESMFIFEAELFCDWLNANVASDAIPAGYYFDLPTEAQWEYACRAGTTTSLNNGTNITSYDSECPNLDSLSWYGLNSGNTTHTVGQKTPNAWGLYDMHGNVSEWCRVVYEEYPTTAVTDPTGPVDGTDFIVRGGNFNFPPALCRSAQRLSLEAGQCNEFIGFRVGLVPIPESTLPTIPEPLVGPIVPIP